MEMPHRPGSAQSSTPSARQADPVGHARRARGLLPGNEIVPLWGGGEAFPLMLAAIRGAQRSVHLETYILRADAVGERFADALRDRARSGVTVRLIYDAVGCLGLPAEFLRALGQAGVEILEYHPLRLWGQGSLFTRRDHRKILVVDDRIAFTGGLNIGQEYAATDEGGHDWYDIHCQVRGPAVGDLSRLFRRVWIREGGRPYPSSASGRQRHHAGASVGPCLVRVLDNRKFRKRLVIRRAYLHAINRAQHTISLMNAYFLPDRGICWALRRAVARGVRVRVVVPEVSDIPVIGYASRHLFGDLVRWGVEVLYWPERMMHAKTAVIDSVWTTIGSYNLDSRSLHYNLEVALEIVDPDLGKTMQANFARDAAECQPVSLSTWSRRSWADKAVSWLSYQLRSQL